ncbi:MAG: CDP-glycerol glycerophosphotransferase family protein [Eubacterium sp.]|nr:CDP-glycerol glycerophosphotransferase family protein [Candidatus Colimonas fimequi]
MSAITRKIRDYKGEATRLKYKYAGYCKKYPIQKNLVLFESFHGRDISDSPLYMCKALIEMDQEGKYEILFSTSDMQAHKKEIEALGLKVKLVHIHSDEYVKALATAEYLVNNSSFPAFYIRREGQRYLQTWHGTPLKSLGKRIKKGIESMHNVQHNFLQADMLMFPNEFTRDAMMGDYNLNDLYTGKVALCGYPRNSIFSDRQMDQVIREKLGNEGISTIAYMPTWRGLNNYEIETDSYADKVNGMLSAIDEVLDDTQKLYVNFHPIIKNDISLGNFKHIENFPEGVDKYQFLNSTDALITDYSSVFFDYSITGKPIILFMYDFDEYMADRGMYLDMKELPFEKIYDIATLTKCLADREYVNCTYMAGSDYVDRFIKYDSADNAVKLCKLFFNGEAGDIQVQDFSKNRERSWTLVDAKDVKTKAQLDRVMTEADGDNEIVVFAKKNFNPEMSSHMYENYLEGVNFVFTVKSIPRTIGEDLQMRFNKSIKKTVNKRNNDRCFPHLNIAGQRKGISFPSAGKVLKIKASGTNIHVKAALKKSLKNCTIKDVILCFRSDIDTIEHSFKFRVSQEGGSPVITADLNVKGLNLDGIYWDMFVVLDTDNGEERLKFDLDRKAKLKLTFTCQQCVLGKEIIFPHITIERQLAFTHRELTPYDSRMTRVKEIFAFAIYKLFGKRIRKQKNWLVFEKFCQMAQDNGYYFFKYCMEELPEAEKKNIYYVMKEGAADWDKVAKYSGHVLKFMSIKHMVYAMAAEVYVGSDSKKHLYIWRPKPNLISSKLRNKKILFLQHGVTALKKVDGIFGAHGSSPMTHFTTTSDYEQKIIVDNFGYSAENAPVLGFTRWDVLEDTSREDDKLILVMPTWRSWLEERTAEEFKNSDYYDNYMKLFTDPRLEEVLEKNDARMIFYIHPKFRDYLGEFVIDSKRIELVPFGSTPLNAIMRDCRMLITDYSSVCWDVYYLGKPVLFYQFDYDMYINTHGSYMDMTSELFGERFFNSSDLIEGLKKTVESNFVEDERAASMRHEYFKYIDNNNCRRTYEYLRKQGY